MTTLAEFRSQLKREGTYTRTAGGVEYFGKTALYEIKNSLTPALRAIKAADGEVSKIKTLDDGVIVTLKEKNGKPYNFFLSNKIANATPVLANLKAEIAKLNGKPLTADYIPVKMPAAIVQSTSTSAPAEPEGLAEAPPKPSKAIGEVTNTPRGDAGVEEPFRLEDDTPDQNQQDSTSKASNPPAPNEGDYAQTEKLTTWDKFQDGIWNLTLVATGGRAAGWTLSKLGAKTVGNALTQSSKAIGNLAGRLFTTSNPAFNVIFRPLQMLWHGTKNLFNPVKYAPNATAKISRLRNLAKLKNARDLFILKPFRKSVSNVGFWKTIGNGLLNTGKAILADTKAIFTPIANLIKNSKMVAKGSAAINAAAKATTKTLSKIKLPKLNGWAVLGKFSKLSRSLPMLAFVGEAVNMFRPRQVGDRITWTPISGPDITGTITEIHYDSKGKFLSAKVRTDSGQEYIYNKNAKDANELV